MKCLVIIPAYNEAENIRDLLTRIKNLKDPQIDMLVINDKSTDETSEICDDEGVKVINLPCNLGIGGAVQTGYKYAKKNLYDIAIQVDGDGQHNPEYIHELIKPILLNEADMSIGSRYINKQGFQSTRLRRIGIGYFSKLLQIVINNKITDPTSGFRACNSKIIETFSVHYPTDYPEPESIVTVHRKGFKVKEVPVIMNERIGGVSSITSLKSVYYMVKVSFAIIFDVLRGNSSNVKNEVLK